MFLQNPEFKQFFFKGNQQNVSGRNTEADKNESGTQ